MKKFLRWVGSIVVIAIIVLAVVCVILHARGIDLLSTDSLHWGKNPGFTLETKMRLVGDQDESWHDGPIVVKAGDQVEVQLKYDNCSPDYQNDVAVWVNLPSCLEYVEGATWLLDGQYPEGVFINENDIVDRGIIIGDFAGYKATEYTKEKQGANAYLRFTAEVVDAPQQGTKDVVIETIVQASTDGKKPTSATVTSELCVVSQDFDGDLVLITEAGKENVGATNPDGPVKITPADTSTTLHPNLSQDTPIPDDSQDS